MSNELARKIQENDILREQVNKLRDSVSISEDANTALKRALFQSEQAFEYRSSSVVELLKEIAGFKRLIIVLELCLLASIVGIGYIKYSCG